MRRTTTILLFALGCAVAGACSSSSNTSTSTGSGGTGGAHVMSCTPGMQAACTCTGQDVGVQTCDVDGLAYGACTCAGGGAGGGTGGADTGDGGPTDAGGTGAAAVVLVSSLSGVQDLAVYTNGVYWTAASSGTVAQCAITGCAAPTILASAQAFPRGIAVASGVVLWAGYQTTGSDGGADLGTLGSALAGTSGSGKTYLAGQLHPDAIAADPNYVYWSVEGQVRQCNLFGCTAPIVLAQDTAQAIAVSAAHVYWTSPATQTVSRCDIGGCSEQPTAIATGVSAQVRGIAITPTQVFWATPTQILGCAIADCASTGPTVLADGQSIVALRHPLATDGTNVYWSSGQSIVRCSVAGCNGQPEEIVAKQSQPTSIAVDAANVYWVDGDAIKKAAKPD